MAVLSYRLPGQEIQATHYSTVDVTLHGFPADFGMLVLGENVGLTVLNVKSLAWPTPSWVVLGSAELRRQKMALSIAKCIVQFSRIQPFGKKSALLALRKQPQDIVTILIGATVLVVTANVFDLLSEIITPILDGSTLAMLTFIFSFAPSSATI
jgi:hypothetical protein